MDKVKLGSELGIQSFRLNSVTAYKDLASMKNSARPAQISYDSKANSVIVPMLINKKTQEFNYAVFHIRMIKNTSIK